MNEPFLYRIVYSHEWRSWGLTAYDADDNQMGESEWYPRFNETKARGEEIATHTMRIGVYYRDEGLRSSSFGRRYQVA